jgi:hypothetical protein
MFVFWYCHKRGKQVRIDREIEEGKAGEAATAGSKEDEKEDELDGSDFDATDSDEGNNDDAMAEQIAAAVREDREKEDQDRDDEHAAALKRKEEVLNKL